MLYKENVIAQCVEMFTSTNQANYMVEFDASASMAPPDATISGYSWEISEVSTGTLFGYFVGQSILVQFPLTPSPFGYKVCLDIGSTSPIRQWPCLEQWFYAETCDPFIMPTP